MGSAKGKAVRVDESPAGKHRKSGGSSPQIDAGSPEIGFVVSRDACVVLNDARAPRPMTVAMIAGAARRMSFLELESFEVDPVVRYPEVR